MRFGLFIMAFALIGLAGCSDVSVPQAKSSTGRLPQLAEVPEPEETVRGEKDPAIVTLEIGARLKERRLSRVEDIPGSIIVPNTNLNAVPVTAALQAVLVGTDVSLSWEAGEFDTRLVSVSNLSGALPNVIEKICASAKVFCGYRRGLLELKEKETFIIELPSIPTKGGLSGAAANTMADTISELAGEQVKVDQQGGNLLYTTDVDGYEHVREYLSQLRHGRPLVVMQLYIWEVTLNSDHGTGINWTDFSLAEIGNDNQNMLINGLSKFSTIATGGASLGATFAGKVNADTVLKFLATQGQVQTISNPQLTFVSGSSAEFRVGGERRYISQVGTAAGSVSSSTDASANNNTVSTDSIETGLTVTINGTYEGGVISALLDLAIQDIISLNETTTESGVTIDLPETSERKVTTSLRVRPGDNLVLAGLVSSRDNNDREGMPMPFGSGVLPTFSRDQLKNSELVILVKPSIVKFADAPPEDKGLRKKAEPLPPQDAVVIDGNGFTTLKVPQKAAKSASADTRPSVEAFPTAPVEQGPVGGATVDRLLLQRGFSHAFDQMQAPTVLTPSTLRREVP